LTNEPQRTMFRVFDQPTHHRRRCGSSPPTLDWSSMNCSLRRQRVNTDEDMSADDMFVCPPTPEPEMFDWTGEHNPSAIQIDGTYIAFAVVRSDRGSGSWTVGSQSDVLKGVNQPPRMHDCESTSDGSVAGATEFSVRSRDVMDRTASCQCQRPCRFGRKCHREDCDFCHYHHTKPTSFSIAIRNRQQQSDKMKTDPLHGLINGTLRWWDKASFKQRKQALRVRSMCFTHLEALRAGEQAQTDDSEVAIHEFCAALQAIRQDHERDRQAVPSSLGKLYALCSGSAPDEHAAKSKLSDAHLEPRESALSRVS